MKILQMFRKRGDLEFSRKVVNKQAIFEARR
jgi:hypothetical protein